MEAIRYERTFPNGDEKYTGSNGLGHIVRNGNIIASGSLVYSFKNDDYVFRDSENREHLCRDGETLYITEPHQGIYVSNLDSKENTNYVVRFGVSFQDPIELHFPFKKSIIDIIDEQLKGVR